MGGQFERLIGVMKQSMNKAIGNGHLHWHEFEEVILDVKTILNNRPPGYVEDYIQMPILTPNLMLFEQLSQIPEEEPAKVEDYDLRKCAMKMEQMDNRVPKGPKRASQSQPSNERSYLEGRRRFPYQGRGAKQKQMDVR